LSNLGYNFTYKEIIFSKVIKEYYLEIHDWWIPIITIIFVTYPWVKLQDHQQDNQCTFYSLSRVKNEKKKVLQ
jgi:hypothetical protein